MKRSVIVINPVTSEPYTSEEYHGQAMAFRMPNGSEETLTCFPIRAAMETIYVYARSNAEALAGLRRMHGGR